jgi:uncharacterized protein (DUF58 family)
MSVKPILSAEERDRVARLQLYARGIVDGLTVGQHRSPHKGFSAEFKEHRPYVQGDEIRSIDWKLFGKTDRLFIRQYEEETNLRCTLLLDQSGSMNYRGTTASQSKHAYAVGLAAALAYLLVLQQDAVGLALIDRQLRRYIPPRSNPGHLQLLMQALVSSHGEADTQLAEVIGQVAPRVHRRGLVLLFSDCFEEVGPLVRALSTFRAEHSEVVIFQIWDRDELEFPFRRRVEVHDLERPMHHRVVDPVALRRQYLERVANYRRELEQQCARQRIELVPCVTDDPHAEVLMSYLASRRER